MNIGEKNKISDRRNCHAFPIVYNYLELKEIHFQF